MEKITLKVTAGVLQQAFRTGEINWNQTQITIVEPRFEASAANGINISIGGVVNLDVKDTYAIWHSHNNATEKQSKNFKRLFLLLAENSDQEMQFLFSKEK
jgi:hypothetical protein